jgi:protein ImuB
MPAPPVPRRYLAVHLPWLPAENARLRKIAPPDQPFVLIEKDRGALRLAALSVEATRLGLTPGMPLADARARVTDLAAIHADPEADAALLDRLVVLARDYTPSVTVDPPQGLMLDIAGCTHSFSNSENELRSSLLKLLKERRLTVRAALADTPDAARALARFGGGDVHALPLEALEMGPDIHLALRRSGFRHIGDLAGLPRGPLAARFGTQLPLLLARLLGEEDPHITPAPVIEPVTAALRFAEPIGRADDVLDAIEALLVDAAGELERRGEGGRSFLMRLHRSDGHVARLAIETGAPTRDSALVLRLLRDRIESLADPLDPGFGYDSIDLAVTLAEPLVERQARLDDEKTQQGRAAIGPLLDRLAVRYGPESVLHFAAGNSHVPERAGYLGPAGQGATFDKASEPGDPPLRPLVLFDPPQRVEVLAAVPDGPPKRFQWRGRVHLVVRQEGPERIASEWWRKLRGYEPNAGRTRDYYRVEDAEGHRFWLFRHGLYGAEAANPDWYLHGLFG